MTNLSSFVWVHHRTHDPAGRHASKEQINVMKNGDLLHQIKLDKNITSRAVFFVSVLCPLLDQDGISSVFPASVMTGGPPLQCHLNGLLFFIITHT